MRNLRAALTASSEAFGPEQTAKMQDAYSMASSALRLETPVDKAALATIILQQARLFSDAPAEELAERAVDRYRVR